MNHKWDERYKEQGFAYGKDPNLFFKEALAGVPPGTILMPADGEGRNGVYAARSGWKVTSCDLSKEGQVKALQLAMENDVELKYIVGDLGQLVFEPASFDAIGLIYAHFPATQKQRLHKQLNSYLRPGGLVILEAFSKKHAHFKQLDPRVGGPQDIHELYSTAEILADFDNYEVLFLAEEEIVLNEGKYHVGKGAVTRFIGKKIS